MNGYKFDKGLDNQRVSNTLSQNDTHKQRKNNITRENWNTSTMTKFSITWSGIHITYHPVEGMRPQSTSVIFSKFITGIQL